MILNTAAYGETNGFFLMIFISIMMAAIKITDKKYTEALPLKYIGYL